MLFQKIAPFYRIRQNGASIVEMAIVVLLFFFLLCGIIDFGLLIYNKQVITNAAREAARFGVIARPLLIDPDTNSIIYNEKITKQQVIDLAKSYSEDKVIVFGNKNQNFSISATFNSDQYQDYCENLQEELEVLVSINYSFIFLPYDLAPIESRAVMLCE